MSHESTKRYFRHWDEAADRWRRPVLTKVDPKDPSPRLGGPIRRLTPDARGIRIAPLPPGLKSEPK
jgi:hypothetical protein